MGINSKTQQFKQQRFKKTAAQTQSHDFFNLLTSPSLLETVDELSPEYRERRFSPAETLSLFLTQVLNADGSCQNTVNEFAINRMAMGLSSGSASTGAYCRARQRLPLDMVSSLVRETGQLITEQVPDFWLWKDRPVRLIDGTTLTMPDTEENQEVYPQQGGQKKGLGFPICRVVGVVCLSSGALLNAAIGRFNGKGGDEQTLLRSMLDSFEPGDLVLGDAFYGTYFTLRSL